jgi:mannosylglycerate hydrolase
VRARVVVARRYTWPHGVEDDVRVGAVTVDTTTTIEVRAGSPVVVVTTELDNAARDHRLRVWFPLPEPATTSTAECAYAVVRRGLDAEGGPTERPLPTFPSRRFVCAGGLTVVHDGLPEYELVDIRDQAGERRAHALALTLLRCTGALSRGPMPARPLPAGPPLATPGAQLRGRHVLRYGVRRGEDVADAYAAVDDAFLPLLTVPATPGGPRPGRGAALDVRGAEVAAVVRDDGGRLTVRVFNPHDRPATVSVPGRRGWRVDLRGRAMAPFEEHLELGPAEIATLALAEEP